MSVRLHSTHTKCLKVLMTPLITAQTLNETMLGGIHYSVLFKHWIIMMNEQGEDLTRCLWLDKYRVFRFFKHQEWDCYRAYYSFKTHLACIPCVIMYGIKESLSIIQIPNFVLFLITILAHHWIRKGLFLLPVSPPFLMPKYFKHPVEYLYLNCCLWILNMHTLCQCW